MRFFSDISHFSQTKDYLPILLGVLNAECTFLAFIFYKFFRASPTIKNWYREYGLNAILFDSCFLFFTIIATRFLYSYLFKTWNLISFVLLAMVVQVILDMMFFGFIYLFPPGFNKIYDFMKKYAKEAGMKALVVDILLIILTSLLSSHLASYSQNLQIVFLVMTFFSLPLLLYMNG